MTERITGSGKIATIHYGQNEISREKRFMCVGGPRNGVALCRTEIRHQDLGQHFNRPEGYYEFNTANGMARSKKDYSTLWIWFDADGKPKGN